MCFVSKIFRTLILNISISFIYYTAFAFFSSVYLVIVFPLSTHWVPIVDKVFLFLGLDLRKVYIFFCIGLVIIIAHCYQAYCIYVAVKYVHLLYNQFPNNAVTIFFLKHGLTNYVEFCMTLYDKSYAIKICFIRPRVQGTFFK